MASTSREVGDFLGGAAIGTRIVTELRPPELRPPELGGGLVPVNINTHHSSLPVSIIRVTY